MIRLKSTLLALAFASTALTGLSTGAIAQTGPGWFVPPAPAARPQAAAAPAQARRVERPSATDSGGPMPQDDGGAADGADQNGPLPNLPQPPVPSVAALPAAKPPPVAVIGVLSVPDVMRNSNAITIVQRVIGARREKLRVEMEHTQSGWRALNQALQEDAPKLTPDQGRARERALRERMVGDRRRLQAENRIIEGAGQVAVGQVERTLIAIIPKVAASHGMNMIMQRAQLNTNDPQFEITEEVAALLNKLLPTVQIPPDGVDPSKLPKDWGSAPAGK